MFLRFVPLYISASSRIIWPRTPRAARTDGDHSSPPPFIQFQRQHANTLSTPQRRASQ